MRRHLVVSIALVACGPQATAPVIAPSPKRAPAASPFERAHAYERGAGVRRDYRAAAEIYRQACDDGRGDISACGAYIRAAMTGRGADSDRYATSRLATKTCTSRRDAFACVVADLTSYDEKSLPPEVMDAVKAAIEAMPACDDAHVDACWARVAAGS
ncbi:MAG TPA: hypothetical protein VMJ10_00570, partial [Kofleriaceae bacterium]|nr:hypothetical protein [Kofleriaceae bacterium]